MDEFVHWALLGLGTLLFFLMRAKFSEVSEHIADKSLHPTPEERRNVSELLMLKLDVHETLDDTRLNTLNDDVKELKADVKELLKIASSRLPR